MRGEGPRPLRALVCVPALMVRGERAPIMPRDWVRQVAGLLLNGPLVTMAGATHAVVMKEPEQLVRRPR